MDKHRTVSWRGRFVFNEIRNWQGFACTCAPVGLEVLGSVINTPPQICSTIELHRKKGVVIQEFLAQSFMNYVAFLRFLVTEVSVAALQ